MAPAKNLQQLLQMRAFAVLAQVFALGWRFIFII